MACRVGILNAKQAALFLCDMQEKFAKTIQYFPEIVSASSRLLKTAQMLDVPVIVTEQYPKGLGRTVPELGLTADIEVIEKTQFSMMTNRVSDLLAKSHPSVKSIILCGIESHVCVQGTALSLLEKGFDVHVVVDAVSSRTQLDRKVSFERMKQAGAFLTTSESVILGLVSDAAHPKFRQVQQLIMNPAGDTGLIGVL